MFVEKGNTLECVVSMSQVKKQSKGKEPAGHVPTGSCYEEIEDKLAAGKTVTAADILCVA